MFDSMQIGSAFDFMSNNISRGNTRENANQHGQQIIIGRRLFLFTKRKINLLVLREKYLAHVEIFMTINCAIHIVRKMSTTPNSSVRSEHEIYEDIALRIVKSM